MYDNGFMIRFLKLVFNVFSDKWRRYRLRKKNLMGNNRTMLKSMLKPIKRADGVSSNGE